MKPPSVKTVMDIVEEARPLLAGHNSSEQGAALGSLVAIWLAGHPPSVREGMLQLHIAMVRRQIPISARNIGTEP